MRTILVDQSSSCCGFAVLEGKHLAAPVKGVEPHGIFEPVRKSAKVPRRLLEMQSDLMALVQHFQPDEMVIEWHHYHGMQSWRAIEPVAASAQMCEMVAANYFIPVYRIKQQSWKAACGAKGDKDHIKAEVSRIVCQFWHLSPSVIKSSDHSDVLGMAAAWAIIGDDLRSEWIEFLRKDRKKK